MDNTQGRKLIFTEEELQQRSSEWFDFRKRGVGASEVATIMGVNPWKTITELWEEKVGLKEKAPFNEAMLQGTRLEPFARSRYETENNVQTEVLCLIHPDYEWMRVSLDGITLDRTTVLEIKCPLTVANHIKQTKGKKVPSWRMPQLQYQLCVARALFGVTDRVHYYSYVEKGAEPVQIEVRADEPMIEELIRRTGMFMDCVKRMSRPSPTLFDGGRLLARG